MTRVHGTLPDGHELADGLAELVAVPVSVSSLPSPLAVVAGVDCGAVVAGAVVLGCVVLTFFVVVVA